MQAPNAKPSQTSRVLQFIKINEVDEVQLKKTEYSKNMKMCLPGGLIEREYHIELRRSAQPTIHPPRKILLSLMPKLKEILDFTRL